MENEFKVGDRVARKPVNNFTVNGMNGKVLNGTIVEVTYDHRYKIKWDEKTRTGQQHSTIQSKFLEVANDDIF